MELNPNHPVTQQLRDSWHKVAAILMKRMGENHIIITERDIEAIQNGCNIAMHPMIDGLHVYLVDDATAQKLVNQHGGKAH